MSISSEERQGAAWCSWSAPLRRPGNSCLLQLVQLSRDHPSALPFTTHEAERATNPADMPIALL